MIGANIEKIIEKGVTKLEFLVLCLIGGFVPGCLFFGILHELHKSEKKARNQQYMQH